MHFSIHLFLIDLIMNFIVVELVFMFLCFKFDNITIFLMELPENPQKSREYKPKNSRVGKPNNQLL